MIIVDHQQHTAFILLFYIATDPENKLQYPLGYPLFLLIPLRLRSGTECTKTSIVLYICADSNQAEANTEILARYQDLT